MAWMIQDNATKAAMVAEGGDDRRQRDWDKARVLLQRLIDDPDFKLPLPPQC
jgi:hypothetical protein